MEYWTSKRSVTSKILNKTVILNGFDVFIIFHLFVSLLLQAAHQKSQTGQKKNAVQPSMEQTAGKKIPCLRLASLN